jgi:hypothetical protein
MLTPLYTQTAWANVRAAIGAEAAILLGNGFSIACDPTFVYNNLLLVAQAHGLSAQALQVFTNLTTTNFEEVLHALDQAVAIAGIYGCTPPCGASGNIQADADKTKQALIDAITQVHGAFSDQTQLPEPKKAHCIGFLKPFKFIYTLNYDFLLYWVWVRGVTNNPPDFAGGDGLNGAGFEYKELTAIGGVRFLHGALHLYVQGGTTHKHVYTGTPLLDLVKNGMASGKYPLFIAEGTSAKKHRGIMQNVYLRDCFEEFMTAGPDLVVFGSALGASDAHLVKAIADNKHLKNLYVSSFGNISPHLDTVLKDIAQRRTAAGRGLTTLAWFDSTGVNPWI